MLLPPWLSITHTYERQTTKGVKAFKRKMENIPSKEKMKEAFEKKDETGDGRLTFSEMKEIIQLFSSEDEKKDPTFDQMCDMICNMADVNGDKMIDFGEILLLMFGDSLEPENAMKGAFRAYDTNGDGYLDKKELAEVLKLSGAGDDPKFVRMTMAMNDDDDDGKLNYEEFCAMMGE
jgi:calmodulin